MTAAKPAAEVPLLIPGTAEWVGYITASKVSAILGLSPYDSPLSCWHKMKGNVPLEQETEDHRRGHYAEPAILAWWRDEHPEHFGFEDHPQYIGTGDLQRFAATPDAFAMLDDPDVDRCLIEAKTARSMDEWGEPGTDEVPAYYLVQVLFQLHLSGIRRAYVPVWGSWFEMAEYIVDYDEVLANGIIGRCHEFWESLQANDPPPLDNSMATFKTLKALHPAINKDEVVQLDRDVAVEFITAKNDLAAAEARSRKANSVVLDLMGSAQYANHGDVRVARRQPSSPTSAALYQVAKNPEALTEQENPS